MEISKELIESCVAKVKEARSRGIPPEKSFADVLAGLKGYSSEIEEVRNRMADILLKESLDHLEEGLKKRHPTKRVRVSSRGKGVFGSIMNTEPYDRHELQLPVGDRD